jgi:hypothetical protein
MVKRMINYRNKEWLENQYINLGKSMKEISSLAECAPSTINRWLNNLEIETKKRTSKGKECWNWKGGRRKEKDGYIRVYAPEHPRAHSTRVYEHILVAEKMLDRYITVEERVHHIKWWEKDNNTEENLCVYPNRSEHQSMHKQLQLLGLDLLKEEYNKGNLIFNKKTKQYELKC